jgi:hypothetical protein
MSRLASRYAIITRTVEFLGTKMATTTEIVDHLVASGLDLGDDPADHVEDALESEGLVDLGAAWAQPTAVPATLSAVVWRPRPTGLFFDASG